jgi:arylsulfatase A-like enzyme
MRVIVVAVSHLHAGYLSCHGNDWIGTPAFDRLAAEGVVFDRHYAVAPEPALARRGWRTGRYEFPMPAGERFVNLPNPADLITQLRAGGCVTSLLADRRFANRQFAEGWDRARVVDAEPETALETFLDAAAKELKRLDSSPNWLLWLEVNALEPPWAFPEEFFEPPPDLEGDEDGEAAEVSEEEEVTIEPLFELPTGPLQDDPGDSTFLRLQQSYAAAVRHVDAALDEFFEILAKRKLLDDVVLIFTTDRGAVLGEHGMVGVHHPWLHEELVHLPLVVWLPGAESAGSHVPALTQSVDLMPTLLDLFGLPIPGEVQGYSLLPLLHGGGTRVRPYACAGLATGMAVEWALRTPEWSFLLPLQGEVEDAPRKLQLFAQPEDRWEVNDVSQHHLELVEHFQQLLRDFVKAAQQPGPLNPPVLRDVEAELAKPE